MTYKFKTVRTTTQTVAKRILRHCDLKDGDTVLEPSAGIGDLVRAILKYDVTVDCVELNKEKRNLLIVKGYTVVGEDFFKFKPEKKYDYVIACPTYKDNIDIEHIMKMYQCVKKGGTVVSLTSPYWMIRNSDRQRKFRKWLEGKDYSITMLKDFSFVENYETQPSAIIKIKK